MLRATSLRFWEPLLKKWCVNSSSSFSGISGRERCENTVFGVKTQTTKQSETKLPGEPRGSRGRKLPCVQPSPGLAEIHARRVSVERGEAGAPEGYH